MIQPYDIVMLVILAGAVLLGVWKGMIWQIASLASLIVSSWVALHFSASVAPFFSATEPWNRFLAMLVLYVMTSLAVWLLFRLVSGIIDRVKLKEFDRQMGAMFGLAKGVLLCIVVTFFAVTLSESARQSVLQSYSGGAIARLTRNAKGILPEDVRSVVGKYIDELDRKLDPNTPPSQPAEKTREQEDLNYGKAAEASLERTLQKASQKLEELGEKAEKKLAE
jgi:membrane protein required for colicin V production